MPQFAGSIVQYPARVSAAGYVGLIGCGTLLLAHPVCHQPSGDGVSPLNALFTSASATCVTGLAVVSTEHDFSWLGQLVILLLIQLGGVGIMTVTTFVLFQFGGRQNLRTRALISTTLGADEETDLRQILRHVISTTFFLEGCAVVVLVIRFVFDHPLHVAIWHAVFHAISAFCNAGFSVNDENLMAYQQDVVVNLTISTLVVLGGIGFPVMVDVRRNWYGPWQERWDRLVIHSKVMLLGSVALLLVGCASFLVLEWDGVLVSVPLWKRPMVALFHSVSCRTAGFNTVQIGHLTNATLFITILLMLIGGGPGSTAGGFKVSTFVILILQAWANFRGHAVVNFGRRTIPPIAIQRATTTAMLFSVLVVMALTILLVGEQSGSPRLESKGDFLEASFEVVSALGTVGLSTGLTPELSATGKCIIIALMFMGRLGPISVFAALSSRARRDVIRFPDEEPLIG